MINGKLPVREKICYGFGDCAYSLTYVFLQIFILAYMTNVAKLPTMAAGTLVLVANIFDAVNDPMIGYIADRKHTKIGRYRPWILFACVPSALFLVLCFMTPDISVTGRIVYSYAVFLIWTVLKTCVQVPYAALSAAMTPDANERAKLGAIREWGANIGSLIISLGVVNIVGHYGDTSPTGYRIAVIAMAAAGALLYLGTGLGTKEHVTLAEIEHEHGNQAAAPSVWAALKSIGSNKYALILIGYCLMGMLAQGVRSNLMTYYVVNYLEDPNLTAMSVLMTETYIIPVCGVLLVPVLTKKFGRRKIMIFGSACMTLVGVVSLLAKRNLPLVYLGGALIGVAYCFTLSVVWGALPDASDYGYHKTGVSVPGMLFAFATLAMGCGSGVAGFLASVVLNFFHYDNTALVQSESVCNGIYLGFGGATIIFGILMMVCGFLYTLNEDKMIKIRADLEERMARN